MRLPYRSWSKTLAKLGLRWTSASRRRRQFHSRQSLMETLERREMLTVDVSLSLANDTGASDSDGLTDDPTVEYSVGGDLGDGWAEVQFAVQGGAVFNPAESTGEFDAVSEGFEGSVYVACVWSLYDSQSTLVDWGFCPALSFQVSHTPIAQFTGSDNYGQTPIGTPASHLFTIKNVGFGQLDISNVTTPTGFSLASWLPGYSLGYGDLFQFTIDLDAEATGAYDGDLIVDTSIGELSRSLSGEVYDPEEQPIVFVAESQGNTEGDNIDFAVRLSHPFVDEVSVDYVVYYDEPNYATGTVVFEPGQSEQTVSIPTSDDAICTSNTRMWLELSNPTNGAFNNVDPERDRYATATVDDNDYSPCPTLYVNDVTVYEGAGYAEFTVTASTASNETITFSANPTTDEEEGQAQWADFGLVAGNPLTIAPGQTTATFAIPIVDDDEVEGDETFHVALSSSINAHLADYNNYSYGVGTILGSGETGPEMSVWADGETSVANGTGYVSFGGTAIGTPVEKTFIITNTGEDILHLDLQSLDLPAGYSITEWPAERVIPNEATAITVQLDGADYGPFYGEFSIGTDDPNANPYTFTMSGQVIDDRAYASVRLPTNTSVPNHEFVDLGETGEGTPRQLQFTVVNTGPGELVLDSQSLSVPAGFSIVGGFEDVTLSPYGGETHFTVQLDAAVSGDYFGFLTFASNDANSDHFTIEISGLVMAEAFGEHDIHIEDFSLVHDTGAWSNDLKTSDTLFSGAVTGGFAGGSVDVQFDHNGDGLIDAVVNVTDGERGFEYDPRESVEFLASYLGTLPVRYRALLRDEENEIVSIGFWNSLTLDVVPDPAGNLEITEIDLATDTNLPGDRITIDPTLYFIVAGDLEGGTALVEFDLDGDLAAESSVVVDEAATEFFFNPLAVDASFGSSGQPVVVSYRLNKRNDQGQIVATSSWDSIPEFTVSTVPDINWTADLGLLNETEIVNSYWETSDPTVVGQVDDVTPLSAQSALGLPLAVVELDWDGVPETIERTIATDEDGRFEFRPPWTSYGERTVHARVKAFDPDYGVYRPGGSAEIAIRYVAGPTATIDADSLQLVHDTGEDADDRITRDATIQGVVSGDRVAYARVEWDTNGNNTAEGATYADAEGHFTALPRGLAEIAEEDVEEGNAITVRFRAGVRDPLTQEVAMGDWQPFAFHLLKPNLPAITGLVLANGLIETSDENRTQDPTIRGQLVGEGPLEGVEIEFDQDNSDTPDGSTISSADGSFQFLPQGLSGGNVAEFVQARVIAWNDNLQQFVTGGWSATEVWYQAPEFAAATIADFQLLKDTGPENDDGETTDPALQGTVTASGNGNSSAYVTVEFDHNGDEVVDGSATTDGEGHFRYVPLGLTLDVSYTIRARVKEWNYVTQAGVSGDFDQGSVTITRVAPVNLAPSVELALAADTGEDHNDGATANKLLVGQVTNDQPGRVIVELDHNGDDVADGLAFTDEAGFFHYDPPSLVQGTTYTITARAVEWNDLTGQYQAGQPTSLTLTYESQAVVAAELGPIALETPLEGNDDTSYSPVIVGTLIDDSFAQSLAVELDLTDDATDAPEQSVAVDSLGHFRISANVEPSEDEYTIKLRTHKVAAATGEVLYGEWQSFSFTYLARPDALPVLEELALDADPGVNGETTDPTLAGLVSNDGALEGLEVQFFHDNLDVEGDEDTLVDGVAFTDSTGHFTYLPSGLAAGHWEITARIKEYNAEQVVQYSEENPEEYPAVEFTLLAGTAGQPQIDTLALVNDSGEEGDDGATEDGTVSGHVANAEAGTAIEIDTNGDGSPEEVLEADGGGDFTFEPEDLPSGLVTIRARLQTTDNSGAWKALSFVFDADPDGESAQDLVAAFSSFSQQWQNARNDQRDAIADADALFQSQSQTAQGVYDAALASAAALRATNINSARADYAAILNSAENTRSASLATAAGQLATDLANFNGNTAAFVMRPFAWPDAPPDSGLTIPPDDQQPLPPAVPPSYTGGAYNFDADQVYQAALAGRQYTHAQQSRNAETTYNSDVASAESAYSGDEGLAYGEYYDALDAAETEYATAAAAGTNPTSILTIRATVASAKRALLDEFSREQQRAQQDYNQASIDISQPISDEMAALLAAEDAAAAALVSQYPNTWQDSGYAAARAALHLDYGTQWAEKEQEIAGIAEVPETEEEEGVPGLQGLIRDFAVANATRLADYQKADAALDKQLADAEAEYAHWESERLIHAEKVREVEIIEAEEQLEKDLAAARNTRTKSLAEAAQKRQVAQQKADIDLWKGRILDQQSAYANFKTFDNTPWSAYQKDQLDHAATYATQMAEKLSLQADSEGEDALTEAQDIADYRLTLDQAAADQRIIRRSDDAASWETFRKGANDEQKAQTLAHNTTWLAYVEDFADAAQAFATDEADAVETRELAFAATLKATRVAGLEAWSDIGVQISGVPDNDPAYLARLDQIGYEFGDDGYLASFAYEDAMTDARAARSLSQSQAEKDNQVDRNKAEDDYNNHLTTKYETYQKDVADHAEEFAKQFAAAYATFVKNTSTADNTASKAFAASDQSIEGDDAAKQSAWSTADAASLATFYSATATQFVGSLTAWSASLGNTAWSLFQKALAQVEKGRVDNLGGGLSTHAGSTASELAAWLGNVSGETKDLADKTADGLKTQTGTLADALKKYAEDVAKARKEYAKTLAADTATHDRNVSSRNKTYQDALAEQARLNRNGEDNAQWQYEYAYTEALRVQAAALREAGLIEDDEERQDAEAAANVQEDLDIKAAEKGRQDDLAIAAQANRQALAELEVPWVSDLGGFHVTLANDAKTDADLLAGKLKTAADTLAESQGDAAKQLAADLAGAEKTYTTNNAADEATHNDQQAQTDGTLAGGLTAVANGEREGTTAARGAYETKLYQDRADALGDEVDPLPLGEGWGVGGSNVSSSLTALIAYQRGAAAADATWAAGKATALNDAEELTSDAYEDLAEDENGVTGSVQAQIEAVGEASAAQAAGLAAADEALSKNSTNNLAKLALDTTKAASKSAESGVNAETKYDLARATAKRDYNNAVAIAQRDRTIAESGVQLEYALLLPVGDPDWPNSTEGQEAQATLGAKMADALADYNTAVQRAKTGYGETLGHAQKIGDAQIVRAGELGDVQITDATEVADAEIAFLAAQNADDAQFESAVSTVTNQALVASTNEAQASSIADAQNEQDFIARLGQATVAVAQAMKTVNVTRTTSAADAAATYYATVAGSAAAQATAAAAGSSSPELLFAAAWATGRSAWTSAMHVPYRVYTVAMTSAEADETIALAQAQVTSDNSRAAAETAYRSAIQPTITTQRIDTGAAQRSFTEGETGRVNSMRASKAAAQKQFDIAAATAAKVQGVAYASADKVYAVGVMGLEEEQETDELVATRELAKANADLTDAQAVTPAEITATIAFTAADKGYSMARAGAIKSLKTEVARALRDQALGERPADEARALAAANASTTRWSAESVAANARRQAEATALANYRSADYAQTALAVSGIHAEMDLPWTVYQTELAEAKADWWENSEKIKFLALTTALNAADTAYQTTVNTAYATWSTTSAAAERAVRENDEELAYVESTAQAAADETYSLAAAAAQETRDNALAGNRAAREINYYTMRRDEIESTGEAQGDAWLTIALTPDSEDAPDNRTFDVAELLAAAQQRVSHEAARASRVVDGNEPRMTFVTTTADADEDYAATTAGAIAARGEAFAEAISAHAMDEADSFASALSDLASDNPSPWAGYDAELAQVDADYLAVVAPASYDLAVAELEAERGYTEQVAAAEHTAVLSLAAAFQTRALAWSDANVALAQDQALAQVAGVATSLPVKFMGAAAKHSEPAQPPASGPAAPAIPGAPADPPANEPKKPATFSEVFDKVAKRWNRPPQELYLEYMAGVTEGFLDGVKDTANLIKTATLGLAKAGHYLHYTTTITGIIERKLLTGLGYDDPIGADNAALSGYAARLRLFVESSVEKGSDLWIHREEYILRLGEMELEIARKAVSFKAAVDRFLKAHGQELFDALLAGDQDRIAALKAELPPELRDALDTVYSMAVGIADLAADQVTPRQIGYLAGQLLYEACEDAAIGAAWTAITGVTVGANGATGPAVVAARVANLSRRLESVKHKLGFSPQLWRKVIDKVQEGVWWALKHLEMCFVAGTPVHTADGLKPIERIRVGNLVFARPENDPAAEPHLQRVVRTVVTHPSRLYHVSYQSAAHEEEVLVGTGEHPFFVVGERRFVPAKELSRGDELLLADGSSAWVTAIAAENASPGETFTTYNFEVQQDHTYLAGHLGVLVHNAGDALCKEIAQRLAKQAKELSDDELRKLIKKELNEEAEKIIKEAEKLGQRISAPELAKHEQDIFKRLRKPYGNPDIRPKYGEYQVDEVWRLNQLENGKVLDPHTGKELFWDHTKLRNRQWDMGHKAGREYADLWRDYMDDTLTLEEFLKEYRDPNNYWPQDWLENQSHRWENQK